MSDTESSVTIRYVADVSKALSELGKLSKEQQKQADEAATAIAKEIAAYEKLGIRIRDVNEYARTGAINDLTAAGKLKSAFGGLTSTFEGATSQIGKMTKGFGEVNGRFNQFSGFLREFYDVVNSVLTKLSARISTFKEEMEITESRLAFRERSRLEDQRLDEEAGFLPTSYYLSDEYRYGDATGSRGRMLADAARRSRFGQRQRAQLEARNRGVRSDPAEDAYRLGFAEAVDFLGLAASAANADRAGDYDWSGGRASVGDRLSDAAGQSDRDFLSRSAAAQRDAARFTEKARKDQAEIRELRLEQMFGPVSDFDKYAAGFQLLEGAVTSAFDAWITGSKSFGAAVKDALAAGAASLAKEAIMQALRHTAFAVGSLAIGGPFGGASAAAHFKAAATWGGVAVVAGAAAKGLGGGQPAAGGGVSPGGFRAGGGSVGSGGGDGRTINIVFGGGDDESPRARSRRVSRALFLAEQQGYSARPPGVEFS